MTHADAQRRVHLRPEWKTTTDDPMSTFSIDVDTASYSNVRRHMTEFSELPPTQIVRIEEMINYFDYAYAPPDGDEPFSVTSEVGPCPWNPNARLVHIGLQGKVIEPEDLPPRNLVFLVDVSGSMMSPDKLPLVQRALAGLTEQLDAEDRISLVAYAGSAGTVLEPTSGAEQGKILEAIARLEAGGSTHGSAGIEQAYALARRHFDEDGINRVILATDGDFNVGTVNQNDLVKLIEAERESGVFLSVLGFGMGDFQDTTMEQLADHGNGNYAYIDGLPEARKVLVEEAGATLVTIAKDVKIQVELDPDAVERFRLVGYENRILAHRDFDDDTKDAGEIGAGHTVTALYEIVPTGDDDDLGDLRLRFKEPQGSKSRKIELDLHDGGDALGETSNDYRFSAAVASFGMLLRGEAGDDATWESTRELAMGAMGPDPMCRRHQMVALVTTAAELAGKPLPTVILDCEIDPSRDAARRDDPMNPSTDAEDSTGDGTWAFVLEVLHLLPPLLAFPLFVMAARDPYRRRRS
jgi:Ca-activated chloride channel family protein